MNIQCQVPILLVQSLIVVSVTPLLLLSYPCNPNIVIIVPSHYYCQDGQDYIVTPWNPIYRRRFCHLYHPRIVHLCNVKEVSPSKRLISKSLIYLFFYFVNWFHNIWYQSFGLQGFAALNKSSWHFRYKFFFYEDSEAEIFRMRSQNHEEHHQKISELGSQYFRRYDLWKLVHFAGS